MKRRDLVAFFGGLGLAGLPLRFPVAAQPLLRVPYRRMAFVYYSKTGHTQSVAEAVRAMTGADLYRVDTVQPYPAAYREATEVVKKEREQGTVRPIKPLGIDLSRYDVIALGTPTWWHHVCSPLLSWIGTAQLRGKFIITCNTHGGGGIMHTREDFDAILKGKGVRLGTHFTVLGAVGETDLGVKSWLLENQLI